jgi:glycosyltransferase involved in cell wall biosynthesis
VAAPISVVIPTRNRPRLLQRTLRSVLGQRGVELKAIVVDDASTTDVGATVAALDDPRVRVVRHGVRRGVSAARNTGLADADTPWVAFVDDDDVWAPEKLRAQLNALGRTGARWSCTGSVNIDHRCRVSGGAVPPRERVTERLLAQNVVPGGGSGVVVDRALADGVGGFDEALSNLADWDFYVRLSLRSALAPVDRPYLGYYDHPEGMAHDIGRSVEEFAYVEAKYADERHRRDVELDRTAWLEYLAGMAYSGGHRWTGMKMYVQLGTQHGRRRSLRTVGMGVMPRAVRRTRLRRGALRELPSDWLDEANAWLAVYRQDHVPADRSWLVGRASLPRTH